MVCIYCSGSTQVTNSRHQKRINNVWRRRKCQQCQAVFTTVEAEDSAQALRVNRHNDLEPFSRDKLLISIYDSLRHRKTAIDDAGALTTTVQSLLYGYIDNATIDRDAIVEITASVLERFDNASATHYRAFHPV